MNDTIYLSLFIFCYIQISTILVFVLLQSKSNRVYIKYVYSMYAGVQSIVLFQTLVFLTLILYHPHNYTYHYCQDYEESLEKFKFKQSMLDVWYGSSYLKYCESSFFDKGYLHPYRIFALPRNLS